MRSEVNSTRMKDCNAASEAVAKVTGVVGAIAGAVCLIALFVLLKNHIRTVIAAKGHLNLIVGHPKVIAGFWATAQWSGIIAATSLGIAGTAALIYLKTERL